MITLRRGSISLLAVVSLAGLVAGCGGSNGDAGAEADQIVKNLQALKPGEIMIQGQRREKFSGPYTFRRGGYILSFERVGENGNLTISLESRRGSKQRPYQLLLADSGQKAGRREVTLSGKLYVHITSTAEGYVLRFTPKARGR
jgi:hypothetical protein